MCYMLYDYSVIKIIIIYNETLTNDIINFEQLGPGVKNYFHCCFLQFHNSTCIFLWKKVPCLNELDVAVQLKLHVKK